MQPCRASRWRTCAQSPRRFLIARATAGDLGTLLCFVPPFRRMRPFKSLPCIFAWLTVTFPGTCQVLAAGPLKLDFNRDIQPILSENCYHCHGPDAAERKGDLRLDDETMAKAARDGQPAILPGDSHASTLIQRIFSDDPDEVMPTPRSNRRLTQEQKDLLRRWVDEGATWGKHWAFQRIERPEVPKIEGGVRHPVDAFVRHQLTEARLAPAPPAEAAVLLRRVSLDLTGLPPTPDEVARFQREVAAEGGSAGASRAYLRVVDRLLASPAFGERWCWDWLDAARYADTNGYQGDPERTMWPWRDWVTRAFNANMPYDEFTLWQTAGDLIPGASAEQKLATGFYRNHMINGEGGRIFEETRVENVMDRVETTGTVWLGLTVGCCRCHDHKFDPLSLKDYYALFDYFNQTSEDGKRRTGQTPPVMDVSSPGEYAAVKAAKERLEAVVAEVEAFELKQFPRPAGKPLTESDAIKLPGNLPQYIAKTEPKNRSVDALLEAVSHFKKADPAYGALLQKHLKAARELANASNSISKVMIMDELATPRPTFILEKGAYDKPTATQVTSAIPAIFARPSTALETQAPAMAQPESGAPGPGGALNAEALAVTPTGSPAQPSLPRQTRLDLARWLVARDNPLTARVTVNRYWQAFFGVGLVKTAEDFGVQGEKPKHQKLLDWLAVDFIESGWDVKALMRLIVTSATYQQSSRLAPGQEQVDPENRMLARGPRFRLPAWMLRDQALAAAGLLERRVGGPGVRPYQPEGIWEEATFGKKTYQQDHEEALYRRTLYTFWRRIVGPTSLFDNAARQVCTVKTVRTNTPLHALVTLNDVTYVEAARVLAQSILQLPGDEESKVKAAFVRLSSRVPAPQELAVLQRQLARLRELYAPDPEAAIKLLSAGEYLRDERLPAQEHAAWTSFCLLLLNLDEVVTKE